MDLLTNLRIDQEIIIFILKLLTISLLSFSVQIFLNFLKFEWVKSTNQVFNFLLLGPIGFAITSVISSNIALSLGMVGALSIIRFRTPVKNSFELVIYFLLLTIGITAIPRISALMCTGTIGCQWISEYHLTRRGITTMYTS